MSEEKHNPPDAERVSDEQLQRIIESCHLAGNPIIWQAGDCLKHYQHLRAQQAKPADLHGVAKDIEGLAFSWIDENDQIPGQISSLHHLIYKELCKHFIEQQEYPIYKIDCESGDVTRIDKPALDIDEVMGEINSVRWGLDWGDHEKLSCYGMITIEASIEIRAVLETAVKGDRG